MLREAVASGNELGDRVKAIMSSGELVDDATMAEVVRDRLTHADAAAGFILDGYPRTLGQADTLAAILGESEVTLDAVVFIAVPEAELVRRALARQRADDTEEVIRQRQEVYRRSTQPLIDHYQDQGLLLRIDGDQSIEQVAASIESALEVGS
jgi:adenylate kinase